MSNKKQQQIISNNENISQIDSFLTELTKGICFSGIPHAKEYERQQNLLQSVQIFKRLHIVKKESFFFFF
ncbi:hypothetical protein Mgra_00000454 [Meloidogyne graminicola]|uniref:Uncharacterized protein n=1 Tax=Meloidogyne graminicola TaxID=189291 RepID=A0A8T0A3X2_9BILA|nr:hypothetical protein Mgra_00000454 [Meloidogyne graminicola]